MFDGEAPYTCDGCGQRPATRTYGGRRLCDHCEERGGPRH